MTNLMTYTSLESMDLLLEKVYSPNTLTAYKNDQNTFLKLVGKTLFEATRLDILNYIEILHLENYSTSTIVRKLHSISKMFSFLVLVGKRTDNPIQDLKSINRNLIPKQVKRIHQILTCNDIAAIKKLENNRTALLIELLYSTGGRISEILSIKKEDIKSYDEISSKVEIRGKGNKSRFLFLENTLIERIEKICIFDSEYLIHTRRGTPINRKNAHKEIKKIIKDITGKNGHPHQLRHLYATTQIVLCKESVKAVSKYLGHSSTAITLDLYVDDELTSKAAILKR